MTLTTTELRDMVTLTIMAYLADHGEMSVDKAVDLVNWVDTQNFEFRLETLRED